jgi:DMSO/TMAO reductase YedYZ molybdopterin-dependent catalytic subunit
MKIIVSLKIPSLLHPFFSIGVGLILFLLGACSQAPSQKNSVPTDHPSPTFTPTLQQEATLTASPSPQMTSTISPTFTPMEIVQPSCALAPIVVPTLPAEIPAYTYLDPTTGLHMTGRVSEIDLESYRLEVTGKVDHPLSLSYDELRCMPRIEKEATLICPGYFADVATWAGASLEYILQLAGIQSGATQIMLYAADGYSNSVSLEEASFGENFLAYEWEGEPLPRLHGFPVRAVFPELQGNKWVKFLIKVEVH